MTDIKPFQIYRLKINRAQKKVVDRIALVDQPAIEVDLQKFNQNNNIEERIKFVVADTSLREILTPVMIPNKIMPRVTEVPTSKGTLPIPWYSVFEVEDVAQIAEDFISHDYLRNFNLWHNENYDTTDIQILDTWVSNEKKGILNPTAFADLPFGTWFIRARINNDKIWKQVQDGTFKGVSIEGFFDFVELSWDEVSALVEMNKIKSEMRAKVKQAYSALEEVDPTHRLLSKDVSEWRHYDYTQAMHIVNRNR